MVVVRMFISPKCRGCISDFKELSRNYPSRLKEVLTSDYVAFDLVFNTTPPLKVEMVIRVLGDGFIRKLGLGYKRMSDDYLLEYIVMDNTFLNMFSVFLSALEDDEDSAVNAILLT